MAQAWTRTAPAALKGLARIAALTALWFGLAAAPALAPAWAPAWAQEDQGYGGGGYGDKLSFESLTARPYRGYAPAPRAHAPRYGYARSARHRGWGRAVHRRAGGRWHGRGRRHGWGRGHGSGRWHGHAHRRHR